MMNDHLARATIVNQFNWAGLTQWVNQNSTGRVTTYTVLSSDSSYREIVPIYSGDSQNLLLWLIQDKRFLGEQYSTVSDAMIQINGFPSGQYQITWYESSTGNVIGTDTTTTGATSLTTSIPPYMRDIVAIIKPE